MKNCIIGIGEILWDVFPERKVLGGAPANFAFHVSQLGFNGVAVSAIGNDTLGKEIIDNLKDKKLNYQIETVDFPTGTVQVTLSGEGIPQYEICENVAWDNIPFSPKIVTLAQSASAVCFGSLAQRSSISHQTIAQFLKQVPADAYKVFDINLRQHFYSKSLIEASFNQCNILKINDEELVVVANLFDWEFTSEEAVCQQLITTFQLKVLVLTKGANGSLVLTPNEQSFIETPKVKVADTVGAGDSFTGAFVAGLLYGKPICEAHQLAVDVSAFVCTQQGAMPELPQHLVQRLAISNTQN
jgi:fructokinase